MKKVWVIIDDKAGNANQAIALAECLGFPYEIKKLKYNFWGFIPNWLRFDTLLGIDLEKSSYIGEPYPEVIVSSGRRTATVSNYIKKANPGIFNIHIMHPDLPMENFDVIALPLHDKLDRYENIKNIYYTLGSPILIKESDLKQAVTRFKDQDNLNSPFVSLIIGGKTKQGDYTKEDIRNLLTKAARLTESVKGSLLITTSRRTNPDVIKVIKEEVKVPYYLYDWSVQNGSNNPYFAFLALSDYIILTGDSVTMCSDALSTGKSTYIYKKDSVLLKKHIKFLSYLEKNNYIKNIENVSTLSKWNYEPLREAEKLASFIKEKLNNVSTNITSKNT